MPFEPLHTDEKIQGAIRRERDTDTVLLLGCSGFVTTSLVSFALVAWPQFMFRATNGLKELGASLAFGCIPALVLGAFAARRFSVPGGCGFVAGSMASAIFLYLRLNEISLGRYNPNAPQPEFPANWVWIIPTVWMVVSVIVALLFLPKKDLEPL